MGWLAGLVAFFVAGLSIWVAFLGMGSLLLPRALRAVPLDPEAYPRPPNLVDGLCATVGISVPRLLVVPDEVPNAMAVGRGRRDASLLLTRGLLDSLDPVEMEAVIARELVRIRRRDVYPATVAAGSMLLVALVAPGLAAALVHTSVGRHGAFDVDMLAAGVTRYPPGLRRALARMATAQSELRGRAGASRHANVGPLTAGPASAVTAWLWTVPLDHGNDSTDGEGRDRTGKSGRREVPELDSIPVRVAALDEL
jgi:Zn-dependent protease with chaperone function